jgi:AcrR family transcriptional regulator
MSEDPWVRAPRQARSQATLERFVDATDELLATRRFEDITVADIVARAERTVGSFYARFDDKYAVLHVLVDRLEERVADVVRAFCDPVRWEGRSTAEFVEESVQLNVAAYRRSTSLFRASLTAGGRRAVPGTSGPHAAAVRRAAEAVPPRPPTARLRGSRRASDQVFGSSRPRSTTSCCSAASRPRPRPLTTSCSASLTARARGAGSRRPRIGPAGPSSRGRRSAAASVSAR